MATIPSIAMIPSGVKASKLYSVLPTDGAGDFTTTRASVATRVNENGLIEEVAANVPRLDYSDGTCPSLLLEPASTNFLTNSSEFTGTLINSSVLRDVELSPTGVLSADKLSDDSALGEHLINSTVTLSMTIGTSYTFSSFFKADGTSGRAVIRLFDGLAYQYSSFNLDAGTVAYSSLGDSKIEAYSNGWYRCSISFTATATSSNPPVQLGIANASNQFSYQGASNLSYYFWGVQYEQNSYATSLINTVATAQTRVADTATGSGNSTVINSTEGVLYGEISNIENDADPSWINISDGNVNNWLFIGKEGNNLRAYLRANNSVIFDQVATRADSNKIALSYKSGDIRLYVNGVQIIAVTDAFSFTAPLNQLNFGSYNGGVTTTKASWKSVQVYTTALSDSELTTLTTI